MANERKKKRPTSTPNKKRSPAAEVVYTPPEPLNRKKLILRLLTVAAVAVALFVGCSIFLKVENIKVSGAEKYDEWLIREASGIEVGEGLLTFGKARAAGRITEELPYVKSVRIGIQLPDTVNIHIEELEVVYSAQDQDGGWWLLTSDGRIVEKTSESKAKKNTLLLGFQLLEPAAGEQAEAFEPETEETNESGEEVVITVTNKDRLDTALEIIYQLELNGIIGKAASLDVTDMGSIELWYGTQYQVELGDPGQIDFKIAAMKQAISQMGSHQSGVLDITFTTMPDKVGYTPFE